MKYIKKVDVTQLVTNTGTIIDSMNPGDDQHTNAPSIDAVKKYVENYSTSETKIGTWIDGKPLYRKVFQTYAATQVNTVMSVGSISNMNVDTICNMKGYIYEPTLGLCMNANFIYSTTEFGCLFVKKSTNEILNMVTNTAYLGNVMNVILEYTKTTD